MSSLLRFHGRAAMPVILQAEKSECALACLAMVLSFHGHRVDVAELRNRHALSGRGVNLKGLMRMAERSGLAGRPLRLGLGDLRKLKLPAVLHWDMHHFVVLKRAGRRKVTVLDPALGERDYDHATLSRHFTGVALELIPAAGFMRKRAEDRLRLRELWTGTRGLPSSLAQLFVLSALLQLFSLALPFYTQIFVDEILVDRDLDLLQVLAIGFFLVTLMKSLTELLRAWVVVQLGNRLGFQFAVKLYRHLLRLPLDWFSRRHMGDILSRFGSLNELRDFLCSGIVEVLIDGLMVLATLSLMFLYSPLLTWVALIAVAVYALLRAALHNAYRSRSEEVLNHRAAESSLFMENLRAIQGIKLFGKEADRLAGWQNRYADVINAGIGMQKLGLGVRFVHGLLVGTENIVLMLLGGYAVLDNRISMGMIIAYITFKDQFYARVFALLDKLFEFRLLELHLRRLADIAHARPQACLDGIGTPPPEVCLAGNLRAQGLAFRFGRDAPLLFREVDLEVGSEEAVAVIGPTGCGKSTLLRLLAGLLEPCEGELWMYGVPVRTMGLNAYRERLAAVMQDDMLLSGSIFDNITFFDPEPDAERVHFAASLAALAQDLRAMPMQYHTLVGSLGAALSGGQVQRILLARALYRRPRLLLLDEATSHLDLETEKAVGKAIANLKIARVIVAHRPQTILMADRILRLTPAGLEPVSHAEVARLAQGEGRDELIAV